MTVSNNFDIQESEISTHDILSFLSDSWKKLVCAAIFGAALGFSGWWFLGSYSAHYVLLNNTGANTDMNGNSLDLVAWKTIQKSLPSLAAQIESEGKSPRGFENLYKTFANEQWWQKNAVPSYVISKSDTKDLLGINKSLDAARATILSLTLTATGPSNEKSLDNVRATAEFLRTGGAYLQIRNILNAYEIETISSIADIQKKIKTTEIEMGYQIQRAKSLEELYRRFAGNANIHQQTNDPKDTGVKYISIINQIVGVISDINQSKENLQRLRDRLKQISIIKTFIEEANPLAQGTSDGLILGVELLKVENQLRDKLAKDDVIGQEILDQLRAQLLEVQALFTSGLKANTAPTSSGKRGMIKSITSGFAAAFFLTLFFLLGQRVWRNNK